jgi:hypothetical protein
MIHAHVAAERSISSAMENKIVTVSGAIILRTNPETHKKEIFATQRAVTATTRMAGNSLRKA